MSIQTLLILIVSIFIALYIAYKLYIAFMLSLKLHYPLKGLPYKADKNIVYKVTEKKELLMDVYMPNDVESKGNLPMVLFVHGEGPESYVKNAKDWNIFSSYGKLMAEQNMIGVTFNHSQSGIGSGMKRYENAASDLVDIVDYVVNNASKWHGDKNKIVVWMSSAGAMYLPVLLQSPVMAHVKCLVSYYGMLDLEPFFKKENHPLAKYYTKNYLPLISHKSIPFFAVESGKDRPLLRKGGKAFLDVAETELTELSYEVYDEGRHGFDGMNKTDETVDIINRTLDFIRSNVD